MASQVDFRQLLGPTLLKHNSEGVITSVSTSSALKDNIVGVFFTKEGSPSDAFSATLKNAYEALRNNHELFEVVYVGTSNDESDFKSEFEGMPWLSVPFDKHEKVAKELGVREYPCLSMIRPDGEVLSKNATNSVIKDPQGDQFPWLDTTIDVNVGIAHWLMVLFGWLMVWLLPNSLF